tara:strand:+ start:27 stop:572 length:546 start_codon:yes stop_codon:yes gene_type:complete
MCGRFIITDNNVFGLSYKPSFNITPSQYIPTKTENKSILMKWSYHTYWNNSNNLFNCRSETMHMKPTFRNAKRCVIFNNGWYEWHSNQIGKTPYFLYSKTNYFAGLYNEGGCLILTRKSLDNIHHIHKRQPVLLKENEIAIYLNGKNLFNSSANKEIYFHKISNKVNNTQNNDSSLIVKEM